MIKSLQIIFSIFIISILTFAGETGKLAGKITDNITGEPLMGANVVITAKVVNGGEQKLSQNIGAASDFEGDYFILNISPGKYTVKASYVGYNSQIVTDVQIDIDKTTTVDFQLSSKAFESEEVLVTAYSSRKLEPDLTATKQVYNISDIQNMAGVANLSDILALQADVIDNHFRGGREGESLYLLGGGNITNPLNNKRAFSPMVNGLQQVEIYTSGFSAEYGNAQSGVVNMATKEGTEQWESSMEVSGSPPYYKTWNESPYSSDNLMFYQTLADVSAWLEENPTQPGRPLWDAGYGFGGIYLPPRVTWPPNPLTISDSLHAARLGQILWMQGLRDVGLEYNNTVDYRVDFSTGGPIAKNLKIFFAGRNEITNPVVPTPYPNTDRQIIGNLTFQPNNEDKLGFKFVYDKQFDNNLGSDWLRWLFDRTFSITKSTQTSSLYGLEWTHVFDHASLVNFKLNILNVYSTDNIELLTGNQYSEDYSNGTNWVDYTAPSNHQISKIDDDRGKEIVNTYDFIGSYTSQFNKRNLVKTGFQLTYYDLNVDRDINASNSGSYRKLKFNAFPYEGALYLQDKLEFEGFIANVGLRLDFYNMNDDYYSDIFSPLRNPNYDPNKPYLERGQYYDRNLAAKTESKIYTKLQPRVGISFPLSIYSVFHLNYGTFTQRPTFNQIFYNQITANNEIEILGNPRLKPENTQSYDIGLENTFPFGIKIDVSAYYKNVSDLVETAYYYDEQQTLYRTYRNRDYANIKGFHVNLEKVDGDLRAYAKYNYESATGKSSNDLNAPVTYFENPPEGEESIVLPPPEDVYLDYDRTHKMVFNVRYKTPKDFGFAIGRVYPLGNFSISTTLKIYSGRPYTYDATGQGLKFNQRTPTEKDLRIRLEKRFPFGENQLTLYAEGFNILNQKTYYYSRTFDDTRNTLKWEKDRENILVYDLYQPYITSQAVYLLQNEPRHFRLGLIYKF